MWGSLFLLIPGRKERPSSRFVHLQNLQDNLRTSREEEMRIHRGTTMIILRDPTCCKNCGKSASGYIEISCAFGLRTMKNGIKREQSWCRECRNKSRKNSAAPLIVLSKKTTRGWN
jgi:hypothetical protein